MWSRARRQCCPEGTAGCVQGMGSTSGASWALPGPRVFRGPGGWGGRGGRESPALATPSQSRFDGFLVVKGMLGPFLR